MPDLEPQTSSEEHSPVEESKGIERDDIPLARCPPKIETDNGRTKTAPAVVPAEQTPGHVEADAVATAAKPVSRGTDTEKNSTEEKAAGNTSAANLGISLAAIAVFALFALYNFYTSEDSAREITKTPVEVPMSSVGSTLRDKPVNPNATPKTPSPTKIKIAEGIEQQAESKPVNLQSLFSYKLIQARSEYDSSLAKVKQAKPTPPIESLSAVNYQFIHSLESAQRSIRPSTNLYQAFSREITLARQYASHSPYIIDIEAIARANPATRLSPYRNAYSARIRALLPSRTTKTSGEEEAAVELILKAREVIDEIREKYSSGGEDRVAMHEELRILGESVPESSANFTTLRATIQSLEKELLETQFSGSAGF